MTPKSDEIVVGRIAGVFGVHGELKCDPTSAGRSLFVAGAALRIVTKDAGSSERRIEAVREHKGRLLIRIDGVDTATQGELYAGAVFYAPRESIELEPGEYLDRDLIGCKLYAPDGTELGTVSRVEHYPSSDMLVVGGNLVPLIGEFIRSIDLQARKIVADLPPGLLDDTQAERA